MGESQISQTRTAGRRSGRTAGTESLQRGNMPGRVIDLYQRRSAELNMSLYVLELRLIARKLQKV